MGTPAMTREWGNELLPSADYLSFSADCLLFETTRYDPRAQDRSRKHQEPLSPHPAGSS
jgi:hypothetical protein